MDRPKPLLLEYARLVPFAQRLTPAPQRDGWLFAILIVYVALNLGAVGMAGPLSCLSVFAFFGTLGPLILVMWIVIVQLTSKTRPFLWVTMGAFLFALLISSVMNLMMAFDALRRP